MQQTKTKTRRDWQVLEDGINPRLVETSEKAVQVGVTATVIGAAILVLGIVYGNLQWGLILVALGVAWISAFVILYPHNRRVQIYLDLREESPQYKQRLRLIVWRWSRHARLVFPPIEDPYAEVYRIPALINISTAPITSSGQFWLTLRFPLQIRDLEKYATSAEVCEHFARVLSAHSVSVEIVAGNIVTYNVHTEDPLAC